ncbi:DUF1802 family protein [Microcoleus sp. CAWBG58]|uniref:DUF1802 family protein n=1 Tax=Microcoleus sp. CAWBG58 TaxID=2841651 RepID=UPI0025E0C214|nr:DUF1802 family protein [Microcoleus sp. CAWBG58]
MSISVSIYNALRLPAADVEALILGRLIVAMPRKFINPGQKFALYPANISINLLAHEQHYRSSFLPVAKNALAQLNSETVLIKAWARCELCQMLNDPESLEALSQLTVWTTEALQQTLLEKPYLFIAYLRVYLLSQPFEIPVHPSGNFVSLPKSLTVTDSTPVLSESIFAKRRQQLEKLEPPEHPELEELQSALVHLSTTNPNAKQLDAEIKIFLGWSENSPTAKPDPDLDWIKTIAQIGNSSDGNTFEKLVRQSLVKLGFANSNNKPKASLNPESTGGAGGLDFYCETPYPVAGECKASKHESVPNSVTAQLIHLGLTHLGQDRFDRSVKIILAAGPLTNPANLAAIGSKMNVIRPETLQKLVELKAKQPGSIDLLQLKPCLEQQPFGEEADAKVNRYIDDVREKLKVRSYLIELVKNRLEIPGVKNTGVDALHGAFYANPNPPKQLGHEEMHEILIELSSPLTGYLGRIKGENWRSDRFYFLRDLLLED